ncbi:hypothetical protein G3T14_00360 [Methylobacterium sp. BTF04]|uniref:glyoxalase superfamily protein n=1 Tax=Methylobacterium sp. BTF04 TaxID=2708300 RepID=UPI0013D17AB5|nr:glyoxalase superfamily protein [Methylobacterium sp. BTF04]NEU10579.1 hypothetical protein [Methylobacterium sp. BTF04]
MRTYRDAKIMARALREELARRQTTLSHGECLDIVARQYGLDNWNILAARLSEDAAPRQTAALAQPKGWSVAGEQRHLYEAGIDPTTPYRLGHPALVRCRYAPDDPAYPAGKAGFATLMQSVAALPYRGRRLCLRADLRTEAVVEAATLWLRVDGLANQTLAFDNMEKRVLDGPLSGSQDWTERRIVLDVPHAAESVHFGFYLRGSGKAWAGGFTLSDSDPDAAPTVPASFLPEPMNLDFTEVDQPTA